MTVLLAFAATMVTGFWPTTLGAWAAVAAAFGTGMASFLGWRNRKRLQQVQVNVDGRLSETISEVAALKAALITARAAPAEEPPAS